MAQSISMDIYNNNNDDNLLLHIIYLQVLFLRILLVLDLESPVKMTF